MYTIPYMPEPPENPACPAGGDHEPAVLVGSPFDHFYSRCKTEDGGVVTMNPCQKCGLLYWSAFKATPDPQHKQKVKMKSGDYEVPGTIIRFSRLVVWVQDDQENVKHFTQRSDGKWKLRGGSDTILILDP